MRLATILNEGSAHVARVEGDVVCLLGCEDLADFLDAGSLEAPPVAEVPLNEAVFLPVVPRPEKIICVGLNYRAHAEESGEPVPAHPPLFAKYWRSLVGPFDTIRLPSISKAVDWEAELVAVLGATLRDASPEEALDAIAGYTVMNDVSMRDWQLRTSQFLQGKTFERSTPLGPVLVTLDELADPHNLPITCSIDDEIVQSATTGDMIFQPHEVISYISQFITLVPGDVVATGTPSGVGGARKPPRFLQDGEVVKVTIEGVGELVNRFVA